LAPGNPENITGRSPDAAGRSACRHRPDEFNRRFFSHHSRHLRRIILCCPHGGLMHSVHSVRRIWMKLWAFCLSALWDDHDTIYREKLGQVENALLPNSKKWPPCGPDGLSNLRAGLRRMGAPPRIPGSCACGHQWQNPPCIHSRRVQKSRFKIPKSQNKVAQVCRQCSNPKIQTDPLPNTRPNSDLEQFIRCFLKPIATACRP